MDVLAALPADSTGFTTPLVRWVLAALGWAGLAGLDIARATASRGCCDDVNVGIVSPPANTGQEHSIDTVAGRLLAMTDR